MDISIHNILSSHPLAEETKEIIINENLLPIGLIKRLDANYKQYSNLIKVEKAIFTNKDLYSGLDDFKEIVSKLGKHGINIGFIQERELFIRIYRFMATKHVLNTIDWQNFETDGIFQLVFPQPGMIKPEIVEKYMNTRSESDKNKIVKQYIKQNTNPHDGKQHLNKPWFENADGVPIILNGVQHKYPQCQLIFDKSTQHCFAFCTYCFRHAQVRADEDMFSQNEIEPVLNYIKKHKEISDMLITGGDGGYLPYKRLLAYTQPLINDAELSHIKSIRIGSRALTFQPEMILKKGYNKTLAHFKELAENGIQPVWMAHFSTPKELLNPATIAAIRRLKQAGIVVKSQSPIMNHISLFTDDKGKVDIERSAQNWIDLGNIFAMLSVGFHSMYCARPTGEHHYFTVPLSEINKVFNKVYRSLASINRPSRYITMTSSAGKISILGTTTINNEEVFALKFNEARNMEWMDKVFLAKFNTKENTIEKLIPYEGDKHFFVDELANIEKTKQNALAKKLNA